MSALSSPPPGATGWIIAEPSDVALLERDGASPAMSPFVHLR
jgi:hypothetical protein